MQGTEHVEQLVDLSPEHSLKVQNRHRVERDGTRYETLWLDELDAGLRLVARYRTWTNQGLAPPYRKQIGWERYSVSGALLDREVRYSKRPDLDYLH